MLMLVVEDQLLEHEPSLQQLSQILATLDAAITLGTLAVEQNMVRPEIGKAGLEPNELLSFYWRGKYMVRKELR